MARLTRQVGIVRPQINLPATQTIGPALVKTAQSLQDIAAQRGADRRTQEAQQFAASLNFERDAEGNLAAPSLPIGDNGLVAPNIYDRTYTEMVGRRYLQQLDVDTETRLNDIASRHILDPEGYKQAAEAYVNKVTSLAPDTFKADVNITAQKRMVEHFNRIVRDTAEHHWDDSRKKQVFALDRIEDEAMSYAVAGDDAAVMEGYLKMVTGLVDGQEPNFWGEAYGQARLQQFNQRLVSAHLIGDITRLPDDELAFAEAVRAVETFRQGDGTVKIVRNGVMVSVPVNEAIPDPELRDVIASNAVKAINAQEAGFVNLTNARHERQYKEFLQQFMVKAVEAEFNGGHADRDWLLAEFRKADATDNEQLKARIRQELNMAFPTGEKPTELELNYLGQAEDMMQRMLIAQDTYAKKQGVERFELLSPEQQTEFNKSLPPLIGVFALPQTNESARLADRIYENMAPTLRWHSEDQGGTPAGEINEFIRTDMQGVGLVPLDAINYFNSVLGNIESTGGEEVMRMLSFFDAMRDTPNLRGKLKTAFGESNYAALAFMQDHMMPSQMQDSAVLADVVERASKGTLFDPWKAMSEDSKSTMEEKIFDTLRGMNDPWFGSEGAAVPFELIVEAKDKIPGVAHILGIDPSSNQLKAVAEGIVEELLTSPDSRWRRDPLGLNADKARGYGMHGPDLFVGTHLGAWLSKQPSNGISEYPPSYWWPDKAEQEQAIRPALQEQLNMIQSEVPLRAGENVHLVYNAAQSVLAREPAYEMYVTTDADPEQITTDMRWNGEPVYFYPQESVLSFREKRIAEEAAALEKRKARQAEQPFFPSEKRQ